MEIQPDILDDFDDSLDGRRFRHVAMRDIELDSRPREKLLRYGAESLTKAELFAILIGSGTPKKNATELMAEILRESNDNLTLLDRVSIDELMTHAGIGEAKAITIKAALELCNRRLEDNLDKLKVFSTSEVIFQHMRPYAQKLGHETCWALMLNNRAQLLRQVKLSEGGRNTTIVDVRILCKKAILAEATSVVLVHNHPSGSLRPSRDDDNLTRSVKTALGTLDIRLLDHLIVTDSNYYSYNENGKI